ncbi:DoxX-like family protein [Cognatiyoonia sediminum]|uniref:DoxX-like family protein n=1 Tax=Cognatiyoonia sediminum TaxID=1508389 RepID=A0A1M5SHS9_9RHOB|nr:DoxX family protein [Cognatiyoonia sediminum]SHH38049.1 DoxX-like family protein [Cognatiyoonia sediminum]
MRILDYFAMALVSFIMLAGASLKLTGNEVALQSFIDLGLPSWFGTFIGVCEALGAIGLWLRPTSRLAALGIAIIMCGAIYYHVVFPPIAAGLPAAGVLIACFYIIGRKGTGVVG